MWRELRVALVGTGIGLCGACAHRTTPAYAPSGVSRHTAPAADVVIASELAGGAGSRTVLAALQVTRPSFLGTRGRLPAVSVDESPLTDLSILGMLAISDICEIRLQRATNGAGRSVVLSNGDISTGDVLLVRTRRQTADCRDEPSRSR